MQLFVDETSINKQAFLYRLRALDYLLDYPNKKHEKNNIILILAPCCS